MSDRFWGGGHFCPPPAPPPVLEIPQEGLSWKGLIKKQKSRSLKHLNSYKAFTECWNDLDNIYKNIEEYNLNKKRKILVCWLLVGLVIKNLLQ